MPNRYDNTGRIDFDWQTFRDHAGQGPCRYWIPFSNGLKPDERVPRSSNPDAVMGDRRLAVRSRLRCHRPAELRHTSAYRHDSDSEPAIDAHNTHDLALVWAMPNGSLSIDAAIFNLTDRDQHQVVVACHVG